MPNGFHGTKEEWERIIAPLEKLDPVLEAFGAARDLTLVKNARNWPNRAFRWDSPVNRLIEIYAEGEPHSTWTFWVCASEDRDAGRYWKKESLLRAADISTLTERLLELLEAGWLLVTSWGSTDLERA